MFKKATLLITLSLPLAFGFTQNNTPKGARLANSIAAIAEEKIITVDEVRRELEPYLRRSKRTPKAIP